MSRLYKRKIELLAGSATEYQDLSELHIKWSLKQWDLQTPDRLTVRVYNATDETAQRVQKEFTQIALQAGYEDGPYGLIFAGTIVQVRRGRENATDSYVEMIATDGDEASNFSVVSASIQAGTTYHDRVKALAKAMGVSLDNVPDLPDSKLPRGRVFYGMTRDHLRDLAFSTNTKWRLSGGKLQMIPLDGYLPGEAVVLSSATGMIGLPEQTIDGIRVRSLLNPMIQVGGRVQIDNASIQQAQLNLGFRTSVQNSLLPSVADDGVYRVIVHECEGDTRGQPWYTDLTCIGLSQPITQSLAQRGYS